MEEVLRNDVYVAGFSATTPGFQAQCSVPKNEKSFDVDVLHVGHNNIHYVLKSQQNTEMLHGDASNVITECIKRILL